MNASESDDAMILQQQTCDELKNVVSEKHPSTLTAILRLSEAYAMNQKLSFALKLAEQTLREREKMLNVNHPDILTAKKWVIELRTMQQEGS